METLLGNEYDLDLNHTDRFDFPKPFQRFELQDNMLNAIWFGICQWKAYVSGPGNQYHFLLDCKNHAKLQKCRFQKLIDELQRTSINTGNVLCRNFWQTRNSITIYNNSLAFLSFHFSFLFSTSLMNQLPKVNGRTYPPRRLAVVASAVVVTSLCPHTRRWSHWCCSGWMPIPASVRLRLCLILVFLNTGQSSLSMGSRFLRGAVHLNQLPAWFSASNQFSECLPMCSSSMLNSVSLWGEDPPSIYTVDRVVSWSNMLNFVLPRNNPPDSLEDIWPCQPALTKS